MFNDTIVYVLMIVAPIITLLAVVFEKLRKKTNEDQAFENHASRFTPSRGNTISSATAEHVPSTISTIYSTELQREMNDTLPEYHEVVIEDLPTYHEVMNGYRYDNNSGVVR